MIRANLLAASALALTLAAPAAALDLTWRSTLNGTLPADAGAGSREPLSGRNAVAIDAAGDVFVALHASVRHGPDCLLKKYARADGTLLWERTYSDGLAPQFFEYKYCAVALDAAGNAYLASTRGNQFVVTKYAGASGALLWESATPPFFPDDPNTPGNLSAVAVTATGDLIVTGGRAASAGALPGLAITRFASATGTVVWDVVEASAWGGGYALAIDPAGDVVVAGWMVTYEDFLTAKYDGATGAARWKKTFGNPSANAQGQDYVRSIATDASGNVFVTGHITLFTPQTGTAPRFQTIKYAGTDGALLWEKSEAAPPSAAYSIVVDAQGDAYVSGTGATNAVSEFRTIRYAGANGAVVWDKYYALGPNGHVPYASKLDNSGNLLVTGTVGFESGNASILTVKHATADGAVLWHRTFDTLYDDAAYAIAIDTDDSVVVAGSAASVSVTPHRDLWVQKYTAAGADVWRQGPLNLAAPRPTQPGRFVIDGAGNLLVAGSFRGPTQNSQDNDEILLAKVSGASGGTTWTTAYAGPWRDGPLGVAVDAAGDVLLSGFATLDASGIARLRTAKYSGATGQLAWQTFVTPQGYTAASGGGMRLDAGNPVVHSPVHTQKYSGVDGMSLWTSPVGGDSIALTAAGDVLVLSSTRLTKLARDSGVELWSKVGAFVESTRAPVQDAAGNTFLKTNGERLLKLSPAGAVLWDVSLAVPAGHTLYARSPILVDNAGDVFLQEAAQDPAGTPLRRTVKLSGATGATIYAAARFSSTDVTFNAIARGPRNTMIVAGRSGTDIFVQRLRLVDGGLIDEYAYQGSQENSSDYALDVLVSGDTVYVLGAAEELATGAGIHLARFESPVDIQPETFTFTGRNNVDLGTVQVSNAVVPQGFDVPVSIWALGDEYSIGCNGVFTTAQGTLDPGQSVCVRHTSASTTGTMRSTFLMLAGAAGGTFNTWTADFDDELTNPLLFAEQQYRDFLGREGEAAGVEFYRGLLANGQVTRTQVVEAFLASPEFQLGLPQCTRLYFSFFNRIPDYGGLMFQVGRYRAGDPLTTIAQNFANSPEFTGRFGVLDDPGWVTFVYQAVLGRAPDAAGYQFYLDRLGDGRLTRGEMMVAFSESPEFQQLVANEVYVTAVYVGLLRRTPDAGGLDFYVNLIEAGLPPGQIIDGFLNSPEYAGRFRQ